MPRVSFYAKESVRSKMKTRHNIIPLCFIDTDVFYPFKKGPQLDLKSLRQISFPKTLQNHHREKVLNMSIKYYHWGSLSITITKTWCWSLCLSSRTQGSCLCHTYSGNIKLPVSTSHREPSQTKIHLCRSIWKQLMLVGQQGLQHTILTGACTQSHTHLPFKDALNMVIIWVCTVKATKEEKCEGVTFILLPDVLIGLHIVLLLWQPLTWVKHVHGHGLADSESGLGHLPLTSNFPFNFPLALCSLLWLSAPSVLIKTLLAICPPICLSPPSSSPTLSHSIPSKAVGFIPDHHHSPPLLEKYPHTYQTLLLKAQNLPHTTKTDTSFGRAADPTNTHTHRSGQLHPRETHMATLMKKQMTEQCGVIWVPAAGESGARHTKQILYYSKQTPRTVTHFSSKSRHTPKTEWQ